MSSMRGVPRVKAASGSCMNISHMQHFMVGDFVFNGTWNKQHKAFLKVVLYLCMTTDTSWYNSKLQVTKSVALMINIAFWLQLSLSLSVYNICIIYI